MDGFSAGAVGLHRQIPSSPRVPKTENPALQGRACQETPPPSKITSICDLPIEILLLILFKCTHSLNDLLQYTLVCQTWRDAIYPTLCSTFSLTTLRGLENSDLQTTHLENFNPKNTDDDVYPQGINRFFASDKVKYVLDIVESPPFFTDQEKILTDYRLCRPFHELVNHIRSRRLYQGHLYDALLLLFLTTPRQANIPIPLQWIIDIGCAISSKRPDASTYLLTPKQWAFFRENLPDILELIQKQQFNLDACLDLPDDALEHGGVIRVLASQKASYDKAQVIEKILENKRLFFRQHRKMILRDDWSPKTHPLLWIAQGVMGVRTSSFEELKNNLSKEDNESWLEQFIKAGITISLTDPRELDEFIYLLCRCIQKENHDSFKQLLTIPIEESEWVPFLYDQLLRDAIENNKIATIAPLIPKIDVNWRAHSLYHKAFIDSKKRRYYEWSNDFCHFHLFATGWWVYIGQGTLLHTATQLNKKDAVQLLLDHKANPNLQDTNGKTPLDIANAKNNVEIADLLRAHGALENVRDKDSSLQLYNDAQTGNFHGVKEALQQDLIIDWQNGLHEAALDIAARGGYLDIVQILLGTETRTTLNPKFLYKTVRRVIKASGSAKIIELLIARMRQTAPQLIQHRDKKGYTLLHRAAQAQANSEVFKILLAAEANPNLRREAPSTKGIVVEQQRALEKEERGHIDYLRDMETGYEDLKYNSIYRFDNVLHAVLHEGRGVEIVEMVLEHITDINALDVFGDSALHLALNDVDILTALLNKGANPFLFNAKRKTPLQRAREKYASSKVIKALEEAEKNAKHQEHSA